jgi:hypothetical protein
MTSKRRLEERFELYAQMAIPAGTPAVVVTMLRQAFLAGASASVGVLCAMAKDVGPGGLLHVMPGMIDALLEVSREMETAVTPVEVKAK